MKRLNELVNCPYDNEIFGVKSDTRDVKPGDLFVAVKGFNVDHADFIDDAIRNGAVAVVTERQLQLEVPTVVVSDVNQVFYDICAKFYHKEDWAMNLVGITGTDGKTTTATILKELLDIMKPCAYIGTNGVVFDGEIEGSSNTTPLTEFLYDYLDKFNRKKCQYVSLEVSSEALLHKRVDELKFQYAILTNISEDHLNYHKTLENYVKCKAKLFTLLNQDGTAILNIDDDHFGEVRDEVTEKVVTYGVNEKADFQIKNVKLFENSSSFDIFYKNDVFHIKSPLVIVCYLENYPIDKILNAICCLEPISGRCEFLDFGQDYKIVLDYAHTVNGIKSILETLHLMKHNRIITVMGSAGGREKEKRSSMGSVAMENSDYVIFTMDDPRWESVDDIIDDLVGDSSNSNYERIEQREDAIAKAFDMAETGDIIAILGKGRDHYMAIGHERVPYCDYDVIETYFNK